MKTWRKIRFLWKIKKFFITQLPVFFLHYFFNQKARKWYLGKKGCNVNEITILKTKGYILIPTPEGGRLITTTNFKWLSPFKLKMDFDMLLIFICILLPGSIIVIEFFY